MTARTVTMQLPEDLYVHLQQTAQATRQSFEAIVLRALQVGSPPAWESAPAEFQAELAALDRLDDAALWRIARYRAAAAQLERYQSLLDKNMPMTPSRPRSGPNWPNSAANLTGACCKKRTPPLSCNGAAIKSLPPISCSR